MKRKTLKAFGRLYDIIKKLRSPKGCAWDREQTPDTMAPNLLEETIECIDAIRQKNDENLKEELGDMYLLVTMIAYMKQQENTFKLKEVLDGISEKLVRRHPHVFADSKAKTSKEIIHQWEEIKRTKEKKKNDSSVLDSVPAGVSAFEHAYYLQKKAAKFGFDWERKEDVYDKVREELEELEETLKKPDKIESEKELGDLFFSLINLSRFLEINPMLALNSSNKKFETRFRYMEKKMREDGLLLAKENLGPMDNYWNEAKVSEGAPVSIEK